MKHAELWGGEASGYFIASLRAVRKSREKDVGMTQRHHLAVWCCNTT